MKTLGIFAALTLAAAPVAILADETPAPQPSATASPSPAPCPAMQQMGQMQGHQMHGDGTMPHGQMQGMPIQGQMQGQMNGQMQGHGAMMGQGHGAMAGSMGMSGGAMPCQAGPSPQPQASPSGN